MCCKTSKKIANHEEDRLSQLPSDILNKILSHLDTIEVVRTGVLSKRWKSVWLFVPSLAVHLNDFKLNGEIYDTDDVRDRFSEFMYEILVARESPSFEKVLFFCSDVDPNLVILWMHAAMKRDVSELEVHFDVTYSAYKGNYLYSPCKLTHSYFSYNKLVVLKLDGYLYPYFPKTSSCFPNLKELELENIFHRDDASFSNLLSSCPVLENLSIIRRGYSEDMKDDYSGTFIIRSSSLKRLTVINHTYDKQKVFKMVIDTPAVEQLEIYNHVQLTNEYVVKDLSSLVKGKFLVLNWSTLLNFLRRLPQLEILIFKFPNSEKVSNILELDVPSCLINRLKTIEIYSSSCSDIDKLRYLLRNAKMLERMNIKWYPEDRTNFYNVISECANKEAVPEDRTELYSAISECANKDAVISFL